MKTDEASAGGIQDHPDKRSSVAVVLSLVGLSALALTQPLLDLIGRNAAFIVAHDLGRIRLVLLAVGLAFGIPLAVAGVVSLLRALHEAAGLVLHDLVIAGLIGTVGLVTLRVGGLGERLPGAVELTVALVAGLGAAVAYHRSPTLRSLVGYSALGAPVVVLLFLLATPARDVLFPATSADQEVAVAGATPPIVMVIFDELPLATLLAESHEIDRDTFPAFAALADDATFFRNATASHSSTVEAVPSLLTGRYTQVNTLPTAGAHPQTLFSVLSGDYRAHALEPLTELCAVRGCNDDGEQDMADTGALLRDLAILQLHLVVPDDWVSGLPAIDAAWRDFGGENLGVLDRDAFLSDARGALREDSPGDFRRFTREISPSTRPVLHVLHTLLPHRPWRFLPDGRLHGGIADLSLGEEGWTTQEWPVRQSLQLHMAQSRYADRLLGGLIRRLEAADLYDRSLLVVVADHGLSLLPGTPPRDVTDATVREIAHVPLFIKVPDQLSGEVTDRPVETVDVAPTIYDLLGVALPHEIDGEPLLSAQAPQRATKRMVDADGRTWTFDTSQQPLFDAVRRKFEILGDSGGLDLYDLAPAGYGHLLGRRVSASAQAPHPRLSISLARRSAYERVRPTGPMVPALVTGKVNGLPPGEAPVLAIAMNGAVAAVTIPHTAPENAGRFRALVSPAAFVAGVNEVEFLLVGRDDRLTPVALAP